MQATTVYLRGDGNSNSGLGHIHRLLALSEMLWDQFNCKFVTRNPLPGIRSLILQTCSEIIEVHAHDIKAECSEFVERLDGTEIVVLDGYLFGTEYQQSIKKKGNTLVCIDDIHNYHFVADAIINPAGGVNPLLYSKEVYSRLYTGPKYALLKKPFLESREEDNAEISSILICMGGADPANFTSQVLEVALQETFDVYWVIAGEAFLHRKELLEQIKNSNKKIHLLSNVNPNDLAHLMDQCSTGITSASNIAYEYASINGELYILKTASNQELLYEYLINEKLAFPFIDFKRKEHFEVQALIEKQRGIFDRRSSKRINRIFNRLDLHKNVTVRKAAPSDLLVFFNWANDPELRHQSYNTRNITLDEHRLWFGGKIQDPRCMMLIFEYKKIPIAQVRFDIGENVIISYSLDKDYRGRGWGESILQKGLDYLLDDLGPVTVIGYVKIKNEGSNRIFKNLGFTQYISNEYAESYRYELRKE